MALRQEDLLDDIIALARELGIAIEQVTYKIYAAQGSYSEKTVYAKFKGLGWDKIIEMASQRALGEFVPCPELDEVEIDDEEGSDTLLPPHPDLDIGLDFDLDSALSESDTRSALGSPTVHEFTLGKHDILVGIPDVHSPFFNRSWMVWVVNLIKEITERKNVETVHVVQLGDALDLYSLGKYEKARSVDPKREVEIGLKPIKQLWKVLTSLPKVKGYQLLGNHDTRSEKYCIKNASALRGFVPTASQLLTFDNVFTVQNELDTLLFTVEGNTDSVMVMHGYLSDSLAHVKKHGMSVMHAHLHRGSDTNFTGKFALDCGFGGDCRAFAFAYTMSTIKREWNLGLGLVEVMPKSGRLQPIFIRCYEE